jgi:magnesium-transporting ATPase (P-type)
MSVIVNDSSLSQDQNIVFVKGSPEKIRSIAKQETIPEDFE